MLDCKSFSFDLVSSMLRRRKNSRSTLEEKHREGESDSLDCVVNQVIRRKDGKKLVAR